MALGVTKASENAKSGRRLVLDNQRMPVSAARSRQHDRFATQIGGIEQIDDMLEQPGIASACRLAIQ